MLHTFLKQLRRDTGLTLQKLSDRVGYGTGNLSSYENGKIKAKDDTLMRILTKGFKLSAKDAKTLIATWRKSEVDENYGFAQETSSYNKEVNKHDVLSFLKKSGFTKKELQTIEERLK